MSATLAELKTAAAALSDRERGQLAQYLLDLLAEPVLITACMRVSPTPEEAEEMARVGRGMFERMSREVFGPEDDGKFVLIDTQSGDYEFGSSGLAAARRLYARRPDARPWLERVGRPTAYTFGMRSLDWRAGS